MTDGILLFGGTGRTGLEVAKILAGRGDSLTAVARAASNKAGLEALDIDILDGDALDRDAISAAFASKPFRAVISTIGGKRGQPGPRPDQQGIEYIVDIAKEKGVQRMLMVTMIGAGDSKKVVSPKVIEVLGEAIEAKTRAEEYLANSGLDYTILRPGGLTGEAATGTGAKTEDHGVMGVITTGDLARLVVECLDDDSTIGHTYHTTDPEIKWQPPLQRGEDLPEKK